jgi:chromosome segregation ATPase
MPSSKRVKPMRLALLLLLTAALSASAAAADKKASREREMLRQMQLSQRQLVDEKAQLEKDKAELGQKVGTLSGESDGLKQAAARADRKAADLQKELEAARKEGAGLREQLLNEGKKLEELSLKHKDLQQTLAASESENRRLESALAQQSASTKSWEARNSSCEGKNLKLYKLSVGLMQRYRNKGVLDALSQAEPFTGIKDVELENVLLEYQDKLDAERVEGPAR